MTAPDSDENVAPSTPMGGQLPRLPGASRDVSLHDQLYRYAEDLQQTLERQRMLEAECERLRDTCGRLEEKRELLRALIGLTADLHIVTDIDGRIRYCNDEAACIGDPETLEGTLLRNWVLPSHQANFDLLVRQAGNGSSDEGEWELRLQRDGDNPVPLIVATRAPVRRGHADNEELHWVLRDITQLREVQFESQISSMVFKTASEGLMITDVEGEIIAVNPAFTRITGYTADEVIGRRPSILRSGMHDDAFYAAFWQSLRDTGAWKGEIYNRRKNGEVFTEWLTVNAARDSDGHILSYIAVFSDLSRILQTERRLAYLAHHDMLTGLPNRLLFQDRLAQTLAHAERTEVPFTLVFIDLDRFKQINDSLGHEVGDIVLKEAAARLTGAVRTVDTVARLGGDEFVIIAPDMVLPEAIGVLCERVIATLGEPIEIDGQELFIGGSLGCACWPQHGRDETSLLKHADNAMYRAKAAGGNTYAVHEAGNVEDTRVLNLENELHRALERGQFRLAYQPQVAAADGELLGVEALLRWTHPEFGEIVPAQFIPLAERSGLIMPIGAWVIHTACAQLAQWDREGLAGLSMAVNLSPRQLRDPDLVSIIRAALSEHGVSPERLELEVTESEIMHHLDADRGKLAILREIGVKIAIDDFGTGYSSLARLMHLPIDSLKLDRSFISELEHEGCARAGAITDAIVRMGRALGVELVAEGVETDAQYDLLSRQGCHVIQGFLTGRPMPPEVLREWAGTRASNGAEAVSACHG